MKFQARNYSIRYVQNYEYRLKFLVVLLKTFIRHIGRKHRKIQYKNRLQYDETIQYNILQYSSVKKL